MSDNESLWGELPSTEAIETPLSILRFQAKALTKISSGWLDGRIITENAGDSKLRHEFRVVASALGNYSVTILHVTHDVMPYPAKIFWTIDSEKLVGLPVKTSEQLKTHLRRILQSDRTRKIIAALMAQVRDAA